MNVEQTGLHQKKTEVRLRWVKAPRPYTLIIDKTTKKTTEIPQEDFFWDAREHLRKLAIGKPAFIEVRSDEATLGSRELGSVFLNDGGNKVDLSQEVISAGFGTVHLPQNYSENTQSQEQDSGNAGKKTGPKPNDQITKLLELQKEASNKGLGLHAKENEDRKKEANGEFSHKDKYHQWRGEEKQAPIKHKCLVETVISGSMVRLTILPTMESIALRIAGVRSPAYRRPVHDDEDSKNREHLPSEPFGAEAQWTTERYTLHRDAEVKFTGFDPDKPDEDDPNPIGGVYYGELLVKDHSIGEILLTSGLATMVEWSAPKDKIEKYTQLQDKAAAGKQKIWSLPNANRSSGSQPTPAHLSANSNNNNNNNNNTNNTNNNSNASTGTNSNAKSSKQNVVRPKHYSYNGKVKSVINGAMYQIENLDDPKAETELVTLSSIVVPQFARAKHNQHHHDQDNKNQDNNRKQDQDEPFSWDAREFVRKRTIGKKVKVTLDYVRPERVVDKKPNEKDSGRSRQEVIPAKSFYTVEFEGQNIGLALVEHGFATVLPGSGDNRSPIYDSLFLAQERAQKSKLGLHNTKKQTFIRGPKDLTLAPHAPNSNNSNNNNNAPNTKKPNQASLPLSSEKTFSGVVEYVISGNRFKVALGYPENIMVIVVLDGVKAPTLAKTNSVIQDGKEIKKETPAEPFALEALEFARNLVHQADVKVSFDRQDRTGAFIGYMNKGELNVAEQILLEGLGHTVRSKQHENKFAAAEQSAKEKRKGIWKDWDPVKEEEERKRIADEREAARAESNNSNTTTSGVKGESIKRIVHVTEVIDSNKFYCQFIDEGKEVEQLNKMMSLFATMNLDAQEPYATPERGEVVLAQFSGDGNWYRAQVRTNTDKKNIPVFYGDFGNSETTSVEYIRKLPEQYGIKQLRFQARECGLAYIRAVTTAMVDSELAEGAAYELKRLIYDQKLPATEEYERPESRQSRNRLKYLNLWANDEQNTYINGELVRRGLAKVDPRPPRNAPEKALTLLKGLERDAHENRKGLWESGDPGDEEESRD